MRQQTLLWIGLGLLLAGAAAFFLLSENKDEAAARSDAQKIVKEVTANWDLGALNKYAHAELLKGIPDGKSLSDFSGPYSRLGKVSAVGNCKNDQWFNAPGYVRATYLCPLKTEQGDAAITLILQREEGQARWLVTSFYVDSDYLNTLNDGAAP